MPSIINSFASSSFAVRTRNLPAAGKSTLVRDFVDQGYERLNRDDAGGRLADLVTKLDDGLAAGARRFVLDNTYPTRSSRNEVLETAWRHGVPARCLWLQTSLEQAQINAEATRPTAALCTSILHLDSQVNSAIQGGFRAHGLRARSLTRPVDFLARGFG